MTTETTYLPAEASAKEGTTVGSSLWIIWNEHGDQRAWVLFILFVVAPCASNKLKPIPSIGLASTDRRSHQLGDLRGLGGLCGEIKLSDGLASWDGQCVQLNGHRAAHRAAEIGSPS